MNKLITIIVPVYNAEEYLQRCIDSIISQTYSNWECILVNDGSSDKSGAICNKYSKKDKRIRVIHTQNRGVSSARNIGIELAKGSYILFIDSDDYVVNDYIASFFIEHLQDDAEFVIQGCSCFFNGVVSRYIIENSQYPKESISEAIADKELFKHGSPYGKLYNTNIIRNNSIKFNTNIHNYEDFFFMLDYIEYVPYIKFISHVGYQYIMDSAGLHCKMYSPEHELKLLNLYIEKTEQYNREKTRNYTLVLVFRYFRSLFKYSPNPKKEIRALFKKHSCLKHLKTTYNSRAEKLLWMILRGNIWCMFYCLMRLKYSKS